jgi:16S rRNA (uracil1498-N3)-methyltransferase
VSHRFFVPDATLAADVVVSLPPDEAMHATRVLRLKPGDAVGLFDGRGAEWVGVVESASGRVAVRVHAPRSPAPEPAVTVALVHAVLKGDKMDDVVRDAVMMGVAAIHPVITSRTETSVAAINRGQRTERWRRIAVASAKQCGRAVVPRVAEVALVSLDAAALDAAGLPRLRLLLAEPGLDGEVQRPHQVAVPTEGASTVIVGPEGGWTDGEIASGHRSCVSLSLGARTLRADRAGLVAVAALFAVWDSR